MRIGILTSGRAKQIDDPAQVPRLVQAGRERGHEMIMLYEPEIVIGSDGSITHMGSPLPALDVVLNRPGFIEEPSLHAVTTDALAASGVRLINHSPQSSGAKNKLTQHLVLSHARVAMPRWAIARRPEWAVQVAQKIGFPLIVKVAFGTHGKGVFLAENLETFTPIVDYLNIRDGNPVIIEEFIGEAERKDLRIFVVGNKVVAAMERVAKAGEIRANASLGGVGRPVALTEAEALAAIAATQALSLEIAGVDLLRSNRGPLVIEVNANPGFEELERATGIDVAGAIISFIENVRDAPST